MPKIATRHFSKNLDKRPGESSICKGFRYKSRDDRLNSPKSGVWIFVMFLFEISQNFERLKNREDSSDLDDSWTKSIATTRSGF